MIQRVNGSLAVSRALGDFEYKNVDGKGPTEQLVSPEPEFYMKKRDKDKDEFLVLACDGVWDVMTNEDICSFVSARMRITDNLEQIANEVIDTCLHKVNFEIGIVKRIGSEAIFYSQYRQNQINQSTAKKRNSEGLKY